MNPTPAQLAYINDLYNQLDTRFTMRDKPQTIHQASQLIRDLKDRIEERFDNAVGEDNYARV